MNPKTTHWNRLPKGSPERAIAKIATIANCNTIHGGASAMVESDRALIECSDDGDDEPQWANVAECCEFTDEQDIANAHLIAAAPDLLSSIQRFLTQIDTCKSPLSALACLGVDSGMVADMRIALAKATL